MAGRPKIELNPDEAKKLGELQCTHAEVAAFFGCSIETIKRRLADDEQFCASYKMGLENGKMSLRRYQWAAAKKGNTAILIWLGKQYLGQRDTPKEEESNVVLQDLIGAMRDNAKAVLQSKAGGDTSSG
jgi:hypothetical protein